MSTIITIVISVILSIPMAVFAGKFCEEYIEEKIGKDIILKFVLLAFIGGFMFSMYKYSITEIIRRFIMLFTIVVIAKIDKKKYIIPNKAILFIFAVAILLLIVEIFTMKGQWFGHLISCVMGLIFGGITFLIGYFIGRGGMGLGDVKLFAAMGFLLGDVTIVPIIMLSLLISAVYGITQLLRKKIKAKDEMPFAPFVKVAVIILLIAGF